MKTNKQKQTKKSILVEDQKKEIEILNHTYGGQKVDLIIHLRYDDECGNGHNSFSITGDLYETGKRSERALISCGCTHDEIRAIAPEYTKYIKWHLMSSDEPLHYIANTIFWATTNEYNKKPNLKNARISAIAPKATLKQLQNKKWLNKRLPQLRKEFIKAMESLGFTY